MKPPWGRGLRSLRGQWGQDCRAGRWPGLFVCYSSRQDVGTYLGRMAAKLSTARMYSSL
jgi:hypothetical protein